MSGDGQTLISAYLDAPQDEAAATALQAWLKQDPANAILLAEAALLHQSLRDLFNGQQQLRQTPVSSEFRTGHSRTHPPRVPHSPHVLVVPLSQDAETLGDTMILPAIHPSDLTDTANEEILPAPPPWLPACKAVAPQRHWKGIAALFLIGIGLTILYFAEKPRPAAISPERIIVATLTSSIDARWGGVTLQPGTPLGENELALSGGFAKLSFAKGVTVIIEGPAVFTPRAGGRLQLSSGKLTANVPPAGKGFTVMTDHAKVIDLGTEFGVAATPAGDTDILVYKGQIELLPAASPNSTTTSPRSPKSFTSPSPVFVSADSARRMDAAGTITTTPPRPADFVRPGQFDKWATATATSSVDPAVRWQAYSERMRRDPSLRVYYAFKSTASSSGIVVPNLVSSRTDGQNGDAIKIESSFAPLQAVGRWADKPALRFDRDSQHRLLLQNYPAALAGQLTVEAWVFANSRENYATIAKNWASLKHGQFYLGIWDRIDHLAAQAQQEDGTDVLALDAEPFPLDRWVHVACVIDGTALRVYRDGIEVATTPCGKVTAHPALSSMGVGYKPSDDAITPDADALAGFWDGSMDELAIFHRALSPEEIHAMYEAGKP